jgi:hypothetical protein
MALSQCAKQFIISILCGNSVLRSTMRTFLNSQILAADAEIAILGAQVARLDILNSFANLEIQTLAAVQNKIQSSLNVLGVPMAASASCPTISAFLSQAQTGATAKALSGFQNLIYSYNKRQYVANTISARVKQLQAFVNQAQEFLDAIDSICNP